MYKKSCLQIIPLKWRNLKLKGRQQLLKKCHLAVREPPHPLYLRETKWVRPKSPSTSPYSEK